MSPNSKETNTSHPKRAPRLWMGAPRGDESLTSWLDRAAGIFGMSRRKLLREFVDGALTRGADLDMAEPIPLWRRLSKASEIPLSKFFDRTPHEPYWLLPLLSRSAYCPQCFHDDLARGRTPYFRMAWSYALAMLCPRHKTPLLKWRDCGTDGTRNLPHEWFVTPGLGVLEAAPWAAEDRREARSHVAAGDICGNVEGDRWAQALTLQNAAMRAGLLGGHRMPIGNDLKLREVLRRLLPPSLRSGKTENGPLQLAMMLDREGRSRRRHSIPKRAKNGRVWVGCSTALDIRWRRNLLISAASLISSPVNTDRRILLSRESP